MRRGYGMTWISVVGVAVAMGVTGCGGSPAPNQTSVAASTPSVDPAVAFTQYEKAAKPVDCSPAYSAMADAVSRGSFGAVKDYAHTYRDVVATSDTQLGTIPVPAAAQPILDKVRHGNAAVLAVLDEMATTDVKDTERLTLSVRQVEAADAAVVVDRDDLRAALGHPEQQAGVAADRMTVADQTFRQIDADAAGKWKAAMTAHDLDGAKAANAIEEQAAQAYLDQLATIDWPAGFGDQVTTLRNSLQRLIDFDRHQVDVTTVAQIVEATPEQSASIGLSDAAAALWNALVKAYQATEPPQYCPPAPSPPR